MQEQSPRHYFIVDLTKYQGSVWSAIDSVKRYVSSRYEAYGIGWFARPEHATYLSDTDQKKILTGLPDATERVSAMKNWILQLSQNGAAGSMFHVLSVDGLLLAEIADLNGSSLSVATHHLVSVIKHGTGGARAAMPPPRSSPLESNALTLPEAIALAKRVLIKGGHFSEDTALHQPKLRTLMIELDERARRNNASLFSVELIKHIVNDGLQKGWLGQLKHHQVQGYEYVWLKERNDETAMTATHVAAPAESRASPPAQSAVTATPSTPSSATQASTRVIQLTRVEAPAADGVAKGPAKPEGLAMTYQSKLSKKRIGSPVQPRDFLYDALEQIVSSLEGRTIPVSELISQACSKAISDAAAAGYKRQQKWESISDCFQNMLLSAGVLVDAKGNPIFDRIGARSAAVAGMSPQLRDRCEALLVETIIREMGSVEYTDWHCYNLGLALYQRGGDNPTPRSWLVGRIDSLLKILEDEGRIEIDAERIMRHRSQSSTS